MLLFDKPVTLRTHRVAEENADRGGKGTQRIYHFDNGYGASVVQFGYLFRGGEFTWFHYGSESTWELAVLKRSKVTEWDICYDTPITSDVMGHLTKGEVEMLLERIKDLPNS